MSEPRNSSKTWSLLPALLTVTLGSLLMPALAGGDVFGPISLLSSTPFQQFEYAHDTAISGDGRYVVFDGSIGGVKGVWRRENRTGGETQEVAGGDAVLPSVSENGQYVSFTTNEGAQLSKTTNEKQPPLSATREPVNVYLRDMQDAPQERESTAEETAGVDGKPAFTLVSARNGSTTELGYENEAGEEESVEEREEGKYGLTAAGRSAIDAEGNKVVFVTTAPSDLAGPHTPTLQVAVRDIETDETQLVSVEYDPATGEPSIDEQTGQDEPVPGGAVFTDTGLAPKFTGKTDLYEVQSAAESAAGASISGDGTTVSWMGQRVARQVRMLTGEQTEEPNSLQALEGAPLWRRIAGGAHEGTRAVTGGPDPENPECVAHPESTLTSTHSLFDPCQGPFESARVFDQKEVDPVPQLSFDGYTVAFLANGELLAEGGGVGHSGSNVYVADMHGGLSRVAALRPLTQIANGAEAVATGARIVDLGISPDGEQVAFSTMRTVFPLGSITYASAPAATPGMAELFDVDLANSTLTRVTHSYEDDAAQRPHSEKVIKEDPYSESEADGSLSPSYSQDGDLLAFSSDASNLVYGDGNSPIEERQPGLSKTGESESDGSDVFVVNRIVFDPTPTAQYISSAPSLSVSRVWSLGVTALSLGNGEVTLYVEVPGAGMLSAHVSSPVRQGPPARSSRAAARKDGEAAKAHAAVTVLTRTVASTTRRLSSSGDGMTTLLLKLGPGYGALAAQKGGLQGTAKLTFTAPGHPALHQSIAVSFVRVVRQHTARRAHKALAVHKNRGRRRR